MIWLQRLQNRLRLRKNQAVAFARNSKVLNLRGDSMRGTAVIFSLIAKNKFINR
jgi:hypothetical protein